MILICSNSCTRTNENCDFRDSTKFPQVNFFPAQTDNGRGRLVTGRSDIQRNDRGHDGSEIRVGHDAARPPRDSEVSESKIMIRVMSVDPGPPGQAAERRAFLGQAAERRLTRRIRSGGQGLAPGPDDCAPGPTSQVFRSLTRTRRIRSGGQGLSDSLAPGPDDCAPGPTSQV